MSVVFITGGVGSGKTRWSRRLGHALGVTLVELDGLFHEFPIVGTERELKPRDQRDRELADALKTQTAIFEGWHFGEWLVPLYAKLAAAIVLDVPLDLREARIRERQRARKAGEIHDPFPLGGEDHLQNMLRWTNMFSVDRTVEEIRTHAPSTCEIVVTRTDNDRLVAPYFHI